MSVVESFLPKAQKLQDEFHEWILEYLKRVHYSTGLCIKKRLKKEDRILQFEDDK